MGILGSIHRVRNEYERAIEWLTKGAEAGLPRAAYNLGLCLDRGLGMAAPDNPAAAGWDRLAADAGDGDAAANLNHYSIGRGRAWQIRPIASSPR
jgi:TPR repeat protein